MRVVSRAIALMVFICVCRTYAEQHLSYEKEFKPPSGKGRVVVVVQLNFPGTN